MSFSSKWVSICPYSLLIHSCHSCWKGESFLCWRWSYFCLVNWWSWTSWFGRCCFIEYISTSKTLYCCFAWSCCWNWHHPCASMWFAYCRGGYRCWFHFCQSWPFCWSCFFLLSSSIGWLESCIWLVHDGEKVSRRSSQGVWPFHGSGSQGTGVWDCRQAGSRNGDTIVVAIPHVYQARSMGWSLFFPSSWCPPIGIFVDQKVRNVPRSGRGIHIIPGEACPKVPSTAWRFGCCRTRSYERMAPWIAKQE